MEVWELKLYFYPPAGRLEKEKRKKRILASTMVCVRVAINARESWCDAGAP